MKWSAILGILVILACIGIGTAADIEWTETNSSAFSGRYEHAACSFDGKLWVSGGYNGTAYLNDVWYSADGATWTCANASAAFTGRAGHAMESLGGKLFVIGGYNATAGANSTYPGMWDVWESTDGDTWTLTTAAPAWKQTYSATGDSYGLAYMGSMVGDGKIWITGGYCHKLLSGAKNLTRSMWTTTDGSTWTDAGDLPVYVYGMYDSTGWERHRNEWMSVAFVGGKLKTPVSGTDSVYPLAGTAYSSYDGGDWTTRTTTGFWTPRADFGMVYYDSQLVLFGGYGSDSTYKKDVWYSSDEGTTWSQYSDADWSIRKGLTATEFDDKIFITGGYGPSGVLGDVWSGEVNTTATSSHETDSQSGAGIQYPPHTVKFKCLSGFGSPLEGAAVTVTPVETTYGSWSWLSDLFGISNDVNIAGSTLSGTTGTDGVIAFLMSEGIQYRVNVTHTDITPYSMLVYPKDSDYVLYLSTVDWFEGGANINDVVTFTVTTSTVNSTASLITVVGNDTAAGFTSGSVSLQVTNSTVPGTMDTLDTWAIPAGSNFTHSFTVTDPAGESYFVQFEGDHSDYGTVERSFGVTFPIETINPLGLSNTELMWVSLIIILMTGLIFTATTSWQGPLLTCFVAWILFGMGWLVAMNTIALIALPGATAISVWIIIAARRDAR